MLRRSTPASLFAPAAVIIGIGGCDSGAPSREIAVEGVIRVDPMPKLEIGRDGGGGDEELFRVVDATRLPDGRILVANDGTNKIKVFSLAGDLLEEWGREGDGPGEFSWMVRFVDHSADSVAVFDRSHRRLSVYDTEGQLLGDRRVEGSIPIEDLVRFEDGSQVLVRRIPRDLGPTGTMWGDTVVFLASTKEERIAFLPAEMWASQDIGGRVGFRHAPFTPRPLYDQRGNCIYFIAGDGSSIMSVSSRGDTMWISDRQRQPQEASEEDLSAWVASRLESVPEESRPEARRFLSNLPTPDRLPNYSELVVDALGFVWLQKYGAPDGPGPHWEILDPRGRRAGEIELPTQLEVFEIGRDYLLGLFRTDVDEEIVQLYSLTRAARSSDPPQRCRVDER